MKIVCFSHLRWNFVFQRPQHLLTRLSKFAEIIFIEEPYHAENVFLEIQYYSDSIQIVMPHTPDTSWDNGELKELVKRHLDFGNADSEYILWYYTPMALPLGKHLAPKYIVYDVMDELSAFLFSPPELLSREEELYQMADVVFTGGQSLYEAKKSRHSNVHCFPSSIDKSHFSKALNIQDQPADQSHIPHPRLGFYGVLDERFDIHLIAEMAHLRPQWHIILIGPVVKIPHEDLPRAHNIHYLGSKSYDQLPEYLASWDIALIPFAKNESTRYISPTKTPEYLAAGVPTISTSITDVVTPYGQLGLVSIGDTAEEWVKKIEILLLMSKEEKKNWTLKKDEFLADKSWDNTINNIAKLIPPLSCTTT